jgi:MFS transporter, Spinster family, sphingosine-1-phosphate transporter
MSNSDTFKYFILTCITSPILGAILSGHVSTKTGGYHSNKTLVYALFAGFGTILAAVPMTSMNDPLYAIMCVWIILFFGAFMLPILTGVMLTTVEQDYKAHANSMANMSYNLLGYLPAPTIYGWVNGHDDKSRRGMALLMYSCIPSVCMVAIVIMIRKTKQRGRGSESTPRDTQVFYPV